MKHVLGARKGMHEIIVGFDDTDVAGVDYGTGKLARWFEQKLPQGIRLHGGVCQQLPVLEGIPYTSQNSAAYAAVFLLASCVCIAMLLAMSSRTISVSCLV